MFPLYVCLLVYLFGDRLLTPIGWLVVVFLLKDRLKCVFVVRDQVWFVLYL